jgi:tRNA (guanosine-2'-O-)-methyltransferase
MPTEKRIERVEKVLAQRHSDLRVVLEEITNTHNASAVARTCDAAGILYVDIIYAEPEIFPVNEAISTRAEKWLHLTHYTSTTQCLKQLKAQGFKIAATHLGENAVDFTELDYTQPLALVFGNESEGISPEALDLADYVIKIPMLGMAQSLNLSVSVGILLYEALRQRALDPTYSKSPLPPAELVYFKKKWLKAD